MDIVVDSVSVATTFKKTLGEKGIIFMSISEAIKEHPELVKKYIGTVIPRTDNYYAALNRRYLVMVVFATSQRALNVQWNFLHTLE